MKKVTSIVVCAALLQLSQSVVVADGIGFGFHFGIGFGGRSHKQIEQPPVYVAQQPATQGPQAAPPTAAPQQQAAPAQPAPVAPQASAAPTGAAVQPAQQVVNATPYVTQSAPPPAPPQQVVQGSAPTTANVYAPPVVQQQPPGGYVPVSAPPAPSMASSRGWRVGPYVDTGAGFGWGRNYSPPGHGN
jgi:hypothetical protein